MRLPVCSRSTRALSWLSNRFPMTKKPALEIFAQIAGQTRATPAENATIKAAYDLLASLVEPTATDAKTVTLP